MGTFKAWVRKLLCDIRGHVWSSMAITRYKVTYGRKHRKSPTLDHTLHEFQCTVCGKKSKKIRSNSLDKFREDNKFRYLAPYEGRSG